MAQQYTPLQPNQTPALGSSGPAVLALQHQYNLANPTRPQLKEDSLYGPITNAALNPNPGIVSSNPVRNDLINGGNQLDTLTNQPDPYLEYLQKKANTLTNQSDQPGTEEKNAARAGGRLAEKTISDSEAYKAGLETLGIQTGLSQFAPGLQADKMINAANSETQKLSDIQDKENLMIAKAKQARLDKDSKTLKDTLTEIKQIKKDKATELENQLTRTSKEFSIGAQHAAALYDTYKTMDPKHQEAFILQASKELGIQNPRNLIDAMVAYHNKQTSKGKSTKIDLNDVTSQLNASIKKPGVLGADGYMDPNAWIAIRDKWITNKLPATTFNTLYQRYLNPESYEKAGIKVTGTAAFH